MRQLCNSTTSLAHALLRAQTWHFPHFRPLWWRLRVLPHALHVTRGPPFSFVLRLTMQPVLSSCVGVRLDSGASGESSVVNGPPCAASAGAALRVFFGGGVFSVAAFRALDTVASAGGPPGACASSKSAISSASSSSRSHSSGSCPAANSASKLRLPPET